MNAKRTITITVLSLSFSLVFSIYAQSQESKKIEPVVAYDFDGNNAFDAYEFSKEGQVVDYVVDYNDSKLQFMRGDDNSSGYIQWNLKPGQYFGWGVILKSDSIGYNGSQIEAISFWTITESGRGSFKVELKDIRQRKRALESKKYERTIEKAKDGWKKVCIPIEEFGERINLTQLEALTLVFDKLTSGTKGSIYVDDFLFEFSPCK